MTRLSRLSDRELLSNLVKLTRRERVTTLEILLHLNEIESRKLHFEQGYASLFEYCTRRLGYSESAAGRRIQVARCLRRYPEIGELLANGDVSLITISLISGIINDRNKSGLLSRIHGKSQRAVERIVSFHRPHPAVRDRVRPVCVEEAVPSAATPSAGSNPSEHLLTPSAGSGSPAEPSSPNGRQAAIGTGKRLVQKHIIQFAAGEELMKKIEEMRSLLSSTLPSATFEQIFDAAVEAYLDKHSPQRRAKKREQRKTATKAPRSRRSASVSHVKSNGSGRPGRRSLQSVPLREPRSRHIPIAVRERVYARDGGRCNYKGSGGRLCGSTRNLQIDHIVPFGKGGTNSTSNLRLLCGKHNRLEAERVYGMDFKNRIATGKQKMALRERPQRE